MIPIMLQDSGERILPAGEGEVSFVYTRHKFAYEYAQQYVTGKTVLDIGCGTGYGCKIMSETAQYVHGIDYHPDAVAYSQKHFSSPKTAFSQHDAMRFEGDRPYDVVVCFQVIEHIQDVGAFLNRLKRLAIPGGTILISTPNVRKAVKRSQKNPYHCNEMNFHQFNTLLEKHFSEFNILGVAFSSRNILREILAKTPLYKLGRVLKRKSMIKKIAGGILSLGEFKIIEENIEKSAADLIGICRNV